MNNHDKRRLRSLKRDVKRAGHKKVRSQAKRDLVENPEEAHLGDQSYGQTRSDVYNGLDHDATRKHRFSPGYRKKLYKAKSSGIISQEDLADGEDLPVMRPDEQGDGESMSPLCSSTRQEGDDANPATEEKPAEREGSSTGD